MALKIKVVPEDFIVEEIAALPLAKTGEFAAYRLRKRGWNTVELLRKLARTFGLPFGAFTYGGKKDRHGLTTQHIAIRSPRRLALEEKNYSLQFMGLMRRPMGPDLIQGNKFMITVRDLSAPKLKHAVAELAAVQHLGYVNYFDDQRFGSFDPVQGFFAQKILKKQYNGALKIYLTSIRPREGNEEKEKKVFFFEHWKDWPACLGRAATPFEKKAFESLMKKPGGFLEILKEIPREDLAIFFSSFQSYLWNEMAQEIINSCVHAPKKRYPGIAGDYIFYTELSQENLERLGASTLPAPGIKPCFSDPVSHNLYLQTLERHGIKNTVFNTIRLRKVFLRSFARNVIVKPQNLSWDTADDELYEGKTKLTLTFILPRGSFATMLIKRIFSLPLE